MQRARDMAAGLAAAGIPGALEGALQYAGNVDLVSRTHFARYLVERGIASDTREVFGRFLVEGKPGYVPHRWATLSEAVGWIRAAGGTAVLAHPGRYKLTDTEHWALLSTFKEARGEAIEVATSNHTRRPAAPVRAARARVRPGGVARQRLPRTGRVARRTRARGGASLQRDAGVAPARAADQVGEITAVAQRLVVHPVDPQVRLLRQAAQIIDHGGVAALPTDSCYALVCHLDDKAAADRLRQHPPRRRASPPDAAVP